MKRTLRARFAIFLCAGAGLILLNACSTDPEARKARYFSSAEKYLKERNYEAAKVQLINAVKTDPKFEKAHHTLATTCLTLGDLRCAYGELEVTVRLNPGNHEAQLQLAGLLLAGKQDDRAQEIAEKVIAEDPANSAAHGVLGAVYATNRDVPNAVRELQKAIELAPQRANNYLALGSVYSSAGRTEEALEAFRKAVQIDPKSPQTRLALSRFYLSQGKTGEAEAEIRSAIELDRSAVLPRLSLAALYQTAGRIEEAEKAFAELKTVAPDDPRAYRALGIFYVLRNERGKAISEFQAVLRAKPQDSTVKALLAEALLDTGQLARAGTLNGELQKSDPKNLRLPLLTGRILLAQGKYQEAVTELQTAVKASPDSARAFYFLGAAQNAAGFPLQARPSWLRALELQPGLLEARVALAELEANSRNFGEALRHADEALKANPGLVPAQLVRARALAARGETRPAESMLEDARKRVESEPRSVAARLALASLYQLSGRPAEAEKAYAELKAAAPDDPQAYRALGLFYLSGNDKGKAISEFQSLLRVKPKDAPIQALLAGLLLDTGQAGRAEALRQELLKSDPKNRSLPLLAGRILLAQRKYPQAVVELQAAVKANPESAAAHYYLGFAQNASGSPAQARPSWLRALELQPGLLEARLALADLEANSGNYGDALRLAGEAIKASPNSLSAQLVRARALLARGDSRQAQEILESILARDPVHMPALRLLVNLRIREGKAAEVLQRISQLARSHPRNGDLHAMLAILQAVRKDMANAEASAREAVALGGPGSEASVVLAQAYLAKGSTDKAKQTLHSAIEANPRNAANCIVLASLYEREGNREQARKLYERAQQIDPESALVANNLAYLYLENGGDPQLALSLAQMASKKMPGVPEVEDTLGWAFYRVGAHETAISHLKACVQKAPQNHTYQYHLGMAYLAAGHSEAGTDSLRKAIAGSPTAPFAASARAALARSPKGKE